MAEGSQVSKAAEEAEALQAGIRVLFRILVWVKDKQPEVLTYVFIPILSAVSFSFGSSVCGHEIYQLISFWGSV